MTSTASVLVPAAALAAARRAQAAAETAQVAVLEAAITWCALHEVTDDDLAATWGDTPIPLAGQGAPLISQFCVAEWAAATGRSFEGGQRFLAHALELAARLPRTLAEVRAGRVPTWRALRIAEQTLPLSEQGAGFVDARVGPFAARVSWAQLDRLIAEATARYCPDLAREQADRAADQRDVVIDTRQISFTGTAHVSGDLDLADALDLDQALAAGAAALKDLGNDLALGPRRALALGAMARSQLELSFPEHLTDPEVLAAAAETPYASAEPIDGLESFAAAPDHGEPGPALRRPAPVRTGTAGGTGGTGGGTREVVLYAHLNAATAEDPDALAVFLDNTKSLVTRDHLATWCGPAARVTIKPVIDLDQDLTASGYAIPEKIDEHVTLRDRRCRFAYCERNARTSDTDHITPFDPDGPDGQTATTNLAALCRRHHRLKTHGSWTYAVIEPGTYLWRSPHGYHYLVDATGTRELTPRPLDPPGQPDPE